MDCLRKRLNDRWGGLAINLKYASCPSCNQWMEAPGHDWFENMIEQAKDLESKILEKSV